MTWRMILINEHAKLTYKNNHLMVHQETGTQQIFLSEIHSIILETTNITLTTALLFKCVQYNIKVIVCDNEHNPISEMLPYHPTHDSTQKIRQQISWEKETLEAVWTEVVRQKIRNQALHLAGVGRSEASEKLLGYLDELENNDETNREALAAKVYFHALFGKGFSREQENDINAFLDWGYSLLLSTVNREIAKNGYLTQLGIHHDSSRNPFNLGSDLMEPFRPVVDREVFQLQQHSFEGSKYQLFQIFNQTFPYKGKKMYLVNILEDYVRKVFLAIETGDLHKVEVFEISEL